MINEARSTWTLGQLADEVIEACELPMGCRGTIIAALGDAKDQGHAAGAAYAGELEYVVRLVAEWNPDNTDKAYLTDLGAHARAALSKNTSTPNPAGVTPYRSDAESGKQTGERVKGPQESDGEEVRSLAVGGAQDTQAGGDSGGMPLSVGRSRPDQTAILEDLIRWLDDRGVASTVCRGRGIPGATIRDLIQHFATAVIQPPTDCVLGVGNPAAPCTPNATICMRCQGRQSEWCPLWVKSLPSQGNSE